MIRKTIKVLGYTLATLSLLVPILLLVLLHSISSDHPHSNNITHSTNYQHDALRLKWLGTRLKWATAQNRNSVIRFHHYDFRALSSLAARANMPIQGQARLAPGQANFLLSAHWPQNPFGAYINMELQLRNSSQGLAFDYLQIGNIKIPGDAALYLSRWLGQLALGKGNSHELFAAIRSITVQANYLQVAFTPVPNLRQKLSLALDRSRNLTGGQHLIAQPARVATYYDWLCQHAPTLATPSLGKHLAALLNNVKTQHDLQTSAADENKAALMAAAIYFGSEHFNTLLNAVEQTQLTRCQTSRPRTTLAGRTDLSLHFMYSAAFKIIADSDMSFALGELKELQDSFRGGSGFSFVDLAADRSGIQLAIYASAEHSARRLQARAEQLNDERNFMPALDGLTEGVSQSTFQEQYGGITGAHYQQTLKLIEQRIQNLSLYQGASS